MKDIGPIRGVSGTPLGSPHVYEVSQRPDFAFSRMHRLPVVILKQNFGQIYFTSQRQGPCNQVQRWQKLYMIPHFAISHYAMTLPLTCNVYPFCTSTNLQCTDQVSPFL